MRKFIPIFIIILAICARLIPGPRTIDDSYITYRYARNIIAGNGFTFNPGEHVLGTTTPLYTLTLTAVGSVFGGEFAPFPMISWILNAILDGIACLILYRLGILIATERVGIFSALIWAIAPFSVTFAIGGLETSLFILLLILSVYYYLTDQPIIYWLCAFFIILTRPDSLILILPLVFFILILKSKHIFLRIFPIIIGSIPFVAWIIFSYSYFGSPIPNSLLAKSVAYSLPDNAAFIRLLQHYLTPFNEQYTFPPGLLYFGLLTLPAMYIIGSLAIIRKDHSSIPLVIYPILYFLIFSIANPLIFRWYLTPPLPLYILTLLTGLEIILSRFFKYLSGRLSQIYERKNKPIWIKHETILNNAITLILILPFVFTGKAWVFSHDHGISTPAPEMAWVKLEEIYQKASVDLLENTTPEDLIAAGDVGVLGYFTGRDILDTVGLNSPIASNYYPLPEKSYVINYAMPTELILDQLPQMVIFLEVYGRETLLRSPEFHNNYVLLKKYSTDLYGSDGMLIYQKVD